MELAEHLQPLVSGHVLPLKRGIDSRLNNVQGYLKYGQHIWGEGGEADAKPE